MPAEDGGNGKGGKLTGWVPWDGEAFSAHR